MKWLTVLQKIFLYFSILRYFHLIPSFQYLKLSLESMSGDPEL